MIERTYHCDSEDCNSHVSTMTPPPYLPGGWVEVRRWEIGCEQYSRFFCSWECVTRFAAARPLMTTIGWDELNLG